MSPPLSVPFPVARFFGFVALPITFLAFVTVATVTYLKLVEMAKRFVMMPPLELKPSTHYHLKQSIRNFHRWKKGA